MVSSGSREALPASIPASAAAHGDWLESVHGEQLAAIERACERGGAECFALFRRLDTDAWALLLTQEHDRYPHIRALLPSVPDPALQTLYNGRSGVPLALQSKDFYDRVRTRFAQHGDSLLAESRVLDFGCGWGRLSRYFARDVEPGRLFGCDPAQQILDECARARLPAVLARSEHVPERIPFDATFDLAFSFSVFTHISETAHLACLRALHAALRPGGVLVLTVRPPEYLWFSPLMASVRHRAHDLQALRAEPLYLFSAHPADANHHQYEGGEMTYGETVVTLPYVRQRWTPMFELAGTDLLLSDPYQMVLTLRRR